MASSFYFNPNLTRSDRLVLQNIVRDIELVTPSPTVPPQHANGHGHRIESSFGAFHDGLAVNKCSSSKGAAPKCSKVHHCNGVPDQTTCDSDHSTVEKLQALNDPLHNDFEPTVFVSWDLRQIKLYPLLNQYFFQPYIEWARKVVRVDTDVVMLTHLILYFTTSVPSAVILFRNFSWVHGLLHWLMQSYYVGTYTLMMHQHIHMRGILSRKYAWLDRSFPYITDPLMGHTWNSYFYHHVKHHHVESNGPNDLSSTIRYQRDDFSHFLHYVGRFFFLIWLDLPRYFIRKGRFMDGLKIATSELANHAAIYLLAIYVNLRAAVFVFVLPFILLRMGLMVGNWAQHAFVDELEPESDFRSSITLIDVASNRHCYNDGYHTSHHLNPRRHWREHPIAFIRQKRTYAQENALVFHNIDYIMITVKLLQKDYAHLARCLVPIGDQIHMSLEERAAMLRSKTKRFTDDQVGEKFRKSL